MAYHRSLDATIPIGTEYMVHQGEGCPPTAIGTGANRALVVRLVLTRDAALRTEATTCCVIGPVCRHLFSVVDLIHMSMCVWGNQVPQRSPQPNA